MTNRDQSEIRRGPTGKILQWTDLSGDIHDPPIDPTQVSLATASKILVDMDSVCYTFLPDHVQPHTMMALVWKNQQRKAVNPQKVNTP